MPRSEPLHHEGITSPIIKSFFEVYNELGFGFLESAYLRALIVACKEKGLHCDVERSFALTYHGVNIGNYRADLVVEGKVIVETKSVLALNDVHAMQVYNYLKASQLRVGLLLNFGPYASIQRYELGKSIYRRSNKII